MEDSILISVKRQLGIVPEFDAFDQQLILNINSIFMALHQLGVGPDTGFRITGSSETWSEYLSEYGQLDMVKDYVYLRTKMIFDPPTSGPIIEHYNKIIAEYEFRINVAVDPVNILPSGE